MCKGKTFFVFVYGTLKVGFPLSHQFSEFLISHTEDTIDGTMYSLGHFPAIKLGGGGEIHGEVHQYPEWVLKYLDQVESEGTLYKRKEVITNQGRPVYVYEFIGSLEGCHEAEDGIWN